MYSINICNCSAILYNGHAPIGAHAGNSDSINTWIEQQLLDLGKMKVYGWHRLIVLKEEEAEAAAKERAKTFPRAKTLHK